MEEIWHPVLSCEHRYKDRYEVSNLGRVRSAETSRIKGSKPGRVLSQSQDDGGYSQVYLWKAYRQHTIKVHRLVAEAFLDKRPAGYQVNHIDGNKQNNRADNLEWVTNQENNWHAHRIIEGRSSIEYKGERMSLAEACAKYAVDGIRPKDARRRIARYGWTIEEALTTPKLATGRPFKNSRIQAGEIG
jgi:hypothetical protein